PGRARTPRPGAGDLATGRGGTGRAGASALPAASRPQADLAQEPSACDPLPARPARTGRRSLRRWRPALPRALRIAGAVALERRCESLPDRRARGADRRDRARATPSRRRPSLPAAVDE